MLFSFNVMFWFEAFYRSIQLKKRVDYFVLNNFHKVLFSTCKYVSALYQTYLNYAHFLISFRDHILRFTQYFYRYLVSHLWHLLRRRTLFLFTPLSFTLRRFLHNSPRLSNLGPPLLPRRPPLMYMPMVVHLVMLPRVMPSVAMVMDVRGC